MSATTLTLMIESGVLDAREVPLRALEETLGEAQERLIVFGARAAVGSGTGPTSAVWVPAGVGGCWGLRPQGQTYSEAETAHGGHGGAGVVECGCRECGRVFAPLLIMLGLSGKRRTDRLTVNLAELGTQVSFARAAELSRELASTRATAGQAHNALADTAALLSGTDWQPGTRAPSPDAAILVRAPRVPVPTGTHRWQRAEPH